MTLRKCLSIGMLLIVDVIVMLFTICTENNVHVRIVFMIIVILCN